MSSSASRSGNGPERTVHQDYIARIRYANTLPPPSNPPKLLEIPNSGISSGFYTSPAFASRLVREQPYNIEIDADLGMPIDLIGLPGVFDDDETSIEADRNPPPIHPHDRALLKPLASLGKPRPTEAAVSFLRRTEYISSKGSTGVNVFLSGANKPRRVEKRAASPEPDAGTPAYVKRKIEHSFAAATAAARDNYRNVRHPTKKNVKLAAAYPLLPDLGAFPDSGAYVTVKFSHTPVQAGTGVYDTRLLSGVFRAIPPTAEENAAFTLATKLWERDPRRHPRPQKQSHYEFYLPDQKTTGEEFRSMFGKPRGTAEPGDDEVKFDFKRVRAYESVEEKESSHVTKYDEDVLLAFSENAAEVAPDLAGPIAGGPRAALYYPVIIRSTLRSKRQKKTPMPGGDEDPAASAVDRIYFNVEDMPDDMAQHVDRFRTDPLELQQYEEAEGEEVEEVEEGVHGSHESHESPEPEQSHRRHADSDDDDDYGRREVSGSMSPQRRSAASLRSDDSEAEDDE